MKVYPYINKNKCSKGLYPVFIIVKVMTGRFTINSGLSSKTVFEGNAFPRSEQNSTAKTSRLNNIISEIEEICINNVGIDKTELKEIIMREVFGKDAAKKKTLADYLREYESKCKTTRTTELYEATARKVEKYDKNADLTISSQWLSRFEAWMAKDLKVNAYAIHLRNIRTIMNWAIDNELTDNYPFRRFKIKHEATRKRNLSASFLYNNIIRCTPQKYQERYRDLFALSFYLIGVNPIDILTAKSNQLCDGRFEYVRSKTHKLYSVKVEPEAQEIIDKYRGKEYLLNYADKSQYRSVAAKANIFLRTIRDDITLYYARHSWASIASEIDIPMETISAALGHSFGNDTTAIYINYQQKKVDEANRKVIDYVLSKGE